MGSLVQTSFRVVSTVLILFALTCGKNSYSAQGLGDKGNQSWKVQVGGGAALLLPNKITGIDEVLTGWSPFVAVNLKRFVLEFSGVVSRNTLPNNIFVELYSPRVNLRWNIPSFIINLYTSLGLQGTFYGNNADRIIMDTLVPRVTGARSIGLYFGGGFFIPIADDLVFRFGLDFNFSPGTRMDVAGALLYQF